MEASQSRQRAAVRTGAEAVAALEGRVTTSGPVRDPSTAEGLSLVGQRAASLAAGRPLVGPRTPPVLPGSSCLHHIEAAPASVTLGAFELVASSAQQALDLTLAGHLMSRRLARPGLLSLAPELAEGLALVHPPTDEVIEACLAPALDDAPEDAQLDAHDPEQVIALAGACLAKAAACLGRECAVVLREGAAQAKWALVAAGGELEPARHVMAALADAGELGVLVSPRLVRPFPAGELGAALAGVRRVVVVERTPGGSGLRAAVRSALPPRIAVTGVAASDGESLLQALVAALGPAAPKAKRARLQRPVALPHRLLVAPNGPWARELERRVLAELSEHLVLRVDHRSRSHLGASVLAWGEASDTHRPQAATDSARDLLIVAGVTLLEPHGALALLRRGGHVLVLADAAEQRSFARRLPKAARSLLLERALGCHWLAPGADVASSADGGSTAEAAPANDHALADPAAEYERLVAAARWLAAGCPSEAARPAGLASLASSEIESASATEEVDFRPQQRGLRWPDAAPNEPLRARWATRLERFHRSGANAAQPALRPAVQPALLVDLQRQLSQHSAHPFVLLRREAEGEQAAGVEARALCELIDEKLRSGEADGREPRSLEHASRALLRNASHLLAQRSGRLKLRALLEESVERLRRELQLPESENAKLCEDITAFAATLPDHACAFALHADTPVCLYLEVLEAVRAPLLRRFRRELEGLRDRLRDLLRLDRLVSEEGRAPESVAAHLGAGAHDLFDARALARTLPSVPASGRLEADRRGRIEVSLAAIEAFLVCGDAQPYPMLLHPPETPLPTTAVPSLSHDDPLAAAVGCFDALAQRGAALHRAVRTARLEVAGRYQPDQHDAALAQLSWEGMQADELALLAPVAVVTTGRRLRRRGQAALSELLRSSRPVHVLVIDEVAVADEAEDLSLFHLDLGYLVMAHREVFALSSTLARPDAFVQGLARMVCATRPGVALVHLASHELAPLRPLHAEAALLGRACPDFLYDPDAGPSWADRFDVHGNPQPDQAWPVRTLRGLRGSEGQGAEEQTLEVAFTFADAVALEPAYQRHLLVFPPAAWNDERQLPLAAWLERLDTGQGALAIPYIWIVDDAGRLQRAAVTRALALASRDRLRGWHVLQELAGFENAHVERAVLAAAQAVRSEADRARTELEHHHVAAVAEAREAGAREALGQLAEALVRGDAAASLVAAANAPVTPATGGSSLVTSPAGVGADAGVAIATIGAAPVAPEAAALDDELIPDEPYVDSVLCTTCNECTNINGRLFAYNGDKQAYIADASAGSFDELVRSAEKCPARCIHPGSPRPDDATATAELVARASAFR